MWLLLFWRVTRVGCLVLLTIWCCDCGVWVCEGVFGFVGLIRVVGLVRFLWVV